MAAVVRIKRKIGDEPAEKLLLCCKRKRLNENENLKEDEITANLKFAGTLSDKSDSVSKTVRDAIRRAKIEKEYKCHTVDVPYLARNSQRKQSKANRLKVALRNRALDLDSLDNKEVTDLDNKNEKLYSLYDLDNEEFPLETITCNSVPMVRETVSQTPKKCDGYVYDVYYLNQQQFDFHLLEEVMTVEAYNEDYMFEGYRDDRDLGVHDDDDDSNDEDNWRNDYPDEDPRFYENDGESYYNADTYEGYQGHSASGELSSYMTKCALAEEENLSSEEGGTSGIWSRSQPTYENTFAKMQKELEISDNSSDDEIDYT